MDDLRKNVVDTALSWERTKYVPNGRVKGAGCDCGTFLLEVFEEAGVIPHTDVGYYAHDHHLHNARQDYLGWVQKFAHEVNREPLPGDIILYTIGKCVSHGAIVVDYPIIIHSVERIGVVRGDASQDIWKSRQSYVYSCFEEGDI